MLTSISTALTSRSSEASLGNSPATLVRRFNSSLSRSSMFDVLSLRRCGRGTANTASPSGMFASSQSASFGAVVRYFSTARPS